MVTSLTHSPEQIAAALTATAETPVWLQVGTVFDGTDVHHDVQVVYDQRRIRWMATSAPNAGLVRPGQRAPSFVRPDLILLPGFVEAHAHLFLAGAERDPTARAKYLQQNDDALLTQAEQRLERLLAWGVMAVRDAGDRNGVGLALAARHRSESPRRLPLVESPGAAIHHQGRYGSFMGRPVQEHADIEAAVAARVAEGAQHIKLLATGIINFEKGAVTARPQMDAAELTQAVAAARRHQRQVMVHCSGHDGVENCIAAGVDTIEHGFFVSDEQLARMRDQDIAWVPTFAPVQFQLEQASVLGWSDTVRGHLRRILDAHAARLRRAVELGVRVIAGSDAGSHGVPHGSGFLRELELMEEAGMPTRAVLHSATGAAARLHLNEPVGTLQVGGAPRFLLTDAPVLSDIRQLRRPFVAVMDGAVCDGGDDESVPGL